MNLTISVDDKLLQRARVRAVREGTSVNEICRRALEAYAQPAAMSRLARYLELQETIDNAPRPQAETARSHSDRSAMYDTMLHERHPTLMGVAEDPATRRR